MLFQVSKCIYDSVCFFSVLLCVTLYNMDEVSHLKLGPFSRKTRNFSGVFRVTLDALYLEKGPETFLAMKRKHVYR